MGNNPAEVIEAVIYGICAFRDELVTPAMLADYPEKKRGTPGLPAMCLVPVRGPVREPEGGGESQGMTPTAITEEKLDFIDCKFRF